jgi:HEAT repeat protein
VQDQIERIRRKLRRVPLRPGRSRSFGEETHGFRLNPPLTERQVQDSEARHSVRLPEGYRLFLLKLGDGGAGPYYGLHPLSRALDLADEPIEGHLTRPCPLVPGMPREDDWLERLGGSADECFRGTIPIVHQGCTHYSLLVISGAARGRVVNVDEDLQPPHFPDDPDFLSWYERWLDEMALGYDLSWFGYRLPGDESDLRAILTSPTESTERRSRAVGSLLKLPALTAESHGPLRSALAHGDSPGLREAAALVLAHFRVQAAVPELRLGIGDPDPAVRKAALSALSGIGAEGWEDQARRLLADADADVIFRALSLLSDANILRFEDVRPLLGVVDPKVRRDALYFLGKSIQERGPRALSRGEPWRWLVTLKSVIGWSPHRPGPPLTPGVEQALRIALDDPDANVRIMAIQAIRDLRPPPFLGVLEGMQKAETDAMVRRSLEAVISAIRSGSR